MDAKIQALHDLGGLLAGRFPDAVSGIAVVRSCLSAVVETAAIAEVARFVRDDPAFQFRMCSGVCGVDYPERPQRFEVVYNLLSLTHNLRLRLKLRTDGETPVPSVTGIWPAANWFEREVWDMYGVFFSGHPDLRRILTDYGFDGHPLRKDFPLSGHVEVRYDDTLQRVVYEPVRLTQEFRSFDFTSPWEGMLRIPPEAEEAPAGGREEQ